MCDNKTITNKIAAIYIVIMYGVLRVTQKWFCKVYYSFTVVPRITSSNGAHH